MPSLSETQTAFLHALTRQDGGAIAEHIAGGLFSPSERLDVYRNTFVSTLVNALRISYPAVKRLVGDEFFEGAAQYFIETSPPSSAYLNAYGAGFGEFLAHFPPAAGLPYLADVARLEWAVNCALHAPDAAPLTPDAFTAMATAQPEHVTLETHPSVHLLRLDYPVRAIWRAVLDEDDEALSSLNLSSGPEWLLIERPPSGVEVTPLDEGEWRFTAALCGGQTLAAAIDAAPSGDVPLFLARHITAGRITGFHSHTANSETLS